MNAEVLFVRQLMTQSGSRMAALCQDIATTKRKTVAELPNAKIVTPSQAQRGQYPVSRINS